MKTSQALNLLGVLVFSIGLILWTYGPVPAASFGSFVMLESILPLGLALWYQVKENAAARKALTSS